MAAEVDAVATPVVMEEIDTVPLSALPPLSPSSVCSLSSSSASSASTPSSLVDSDALSATSTTSHDNDCTTMQPPPLATKQLHQHSSYECPVDDGDIKHLLPTLGEGSMIHPLAQYTAFAAPLSFSHFVHFINKPDPTQSAAIHCGDEQRSEVQSQQPSNTPVPTTAPQSVSPPSSSSSSAPTLTCSDPQLQATTVETSSALTCDGRSVTFTLESAVIATLPIVTSSTIHDDYAQLQQKRLLRAKLPKPSAPQPTAPATNAACTDSVAPPVVAAADATAPLPATRPRGRPRGKLSSVGGTRRKRSAAAAKPNLVITFKRVRPTTQPRPATSSAAASDPNATTCETPSEPLPLSQPAAHNATADGASNVVEAAVVEDREARKFRLLVEHIKARERQDKAKQARKEWQVIQQQQPTTDTTNTAAVKAADTADDILSAAERHDERLARIEAAPLLTPTAAEFRNPMRYIRHIVNQHRQYGVVCIRPPEGWRPAYEYTLDKEGVSFPCKRQVVKRYYGQTKEEKVVTEERKEEERESTDMRQRSHLDAIALQVSAFSHHEQLTMAEFRRDEAARRVEWEQLRVKWRNKAIQRQQAQQQQPTPAQSVVPPTNAVMAELVADTLMADHNETSIEQSTQTADTANTPPEVTTQTAVDCPTMDEDTVHTSPITNVADISPPVATIVLPEVELASTPLDATTDNNNNSTPITTAHIAIATPATAILLPPLSATTTHAQVENDYWRWAMLYGKNRPTVYYANDVDTHPEQRTALPQLPSDSPLLTLPPSPYHPWDLSALNSLPSSFLHHLSRSIPGITAPMLYIGMLHSTFCWHHEDHHLYSISYNHAGSLPKTWYGVPGSHCAAVEQLANHHLYPFFDSTRSHLLARKTSMFTPVLLHEAGIPVYRAVQEEGMFVITFPRAYHSGFSHGFSMAESVNFALDDWLADGGEATRMYRQLSQFPVVPFTELVVRAVETTVRQYGGCSVDGYDGDIGVDGLVRLECTFAELVLDELNEREQLYGSGRHPRLSFAHLRCQSATRYCKSCLHATYLSHVRCECRVGGGVCLSGHGLCRLHREESEVVLAYSSIELITLLSDLQSAMLNVKRAVRDRRAAEGGGADVSVEGEVVSQEEDKAAVKLRNERFDQCVALATSLSDRECRAREMYVLLADQHDEEDDRPRRRMSGSGVGGGGGRKRKKRLSDTDAEQPSVDAIAPATAAPMLVDVEATVVQSDATRPAVEDGQPDNKSVGCTLSNQLTEATVEAAAVVKEAALVLLHSRSWLTQTA